MSIWISLRENNDAYFAPYFAHSQMGGSADTLKLGALGLIAKICFLYSVFARRYSLPSAMKTKTYDYKDLVIKLCVARNHTFIAKGELAELTRNIGCCKWLELNRMHGSGVACHQTGMPKDEWCEVCKQKLPVWKNYKAKKYAAGLAFRTLLRAGKRAYMETLSF